MAGVPAEVRVQGLPDDERAAETVEHRGVDDPVVGVICDLRRKKAGQLAIGFKRLIANICITVSRASKQVETLYVDGEKFNLVS